MPYEVYSENPYTNPDIPFEDIDRGYYKAFVSMKFSIGNTKIEWAFEEDDRSEISSLELITHEGYNKCYIGKFEVTKKNGEYTISRTFVRSEFVSIEIDIDDSTAFETMIRDGWASYKEIFHLPDDY